MGRGRLGLAGPETFHLAHLLTELFREWVCGGGRKFGDASAGWQSALFRARKPDGTTVKINSWGAWNSKMGSAKRQRKRTMGAAPRAFSMRN